MEKHQGLLKLDVPLRGKGGRWEFHCRQTFGGMFSNKFQFTNFNILLEEFTKTEVFTKT